MNNNFDIDEMLSYIDPSLPYPQWLAIGMSLNAGGYDIDVWKRWSQKSSVYCDNDCEEHWFTFNPDGDISIGTAMWYAQQNGWKRPKGYVVESPKQKKQSIDMFRRYLDALHDDEDEICIVWDSTYNDERGKWSPKNGGVAFSVKELKEKMSVAQALGDVVGNYSVKAGCWIRINPMSKFGSSDEDVTKFKYALVESDDMTKEEQLHLMVDELKLPLAALVDSGGKSIHGIVKIYARDHFEYTERVQYLYRICRNYGLTIDEANRNPSRMSRLPGAMRGGYLQKLIDVNVGSTDWDEWKNYIHKRETGLPRMKTLSELIATPPILAEPLIDGLLRKGRKMLISGASKTGKSFSLIGLAYALAFGRKWMGFPCSKCKVLYLNLEIADDSFDTRLVDVARALGITTEELVANDNLRWLDMRGVNKSLEELSASIIDICKDENFGAIILDPIYKVSFANENDAQEMAKFCNAIDTICQSLNTAMIYCHHHSKGSQSGKSAIDRMSGSGVLARDPDAIVDLLELEYTKDAREILIDSKTRETIEYYLDTYSPDWLDSIPDDTDLDDLEMLKQCTTYRLSNSVKKLMEEDLKEKTDAINNITPIRFSASVREFPPLNPRNVYFMHPLHYPDMYDAFIEAQPLDQATLNKGNEKKKNDKLARVARLKQLYVTGDLPLDDDGYAKVKDASEVMGISPKTVINYIKEFSESFEFIKSKNNRNKTKFRMKNTKV